MGLSDHNIVLLICVASLAALLLQRRVRDVVMEAIHNFRGGPPTAMHPSPSNDAAMLLRRRRKAAE